MISRHTSSVPNEDVDSARIVTSVPGCSQASRWCIQDCCTHTEPYCRCGQTCRLHSQVLPWLSLDLVYHRYVVASSSRCTRMALHRPSQLSDFRTMGLWSDNSQTLPESPGDNDTFSRWVRVISILRDYAVMAGVKFCGHWVMGWPQPYCVISM